MSKTKKKHKNDINTIEVNNILLNKDSIDNIIKENSDSNDILFIENINLNKLTFYENDNEVDNNIDVDENEFTLLNISEEKNTHFETNNDKIKEKFITLEEWYSNNILCWYCTCSFNNKPIFIPKKINIDNIDVEGNYCSFNCCFKYINIHYIIDDKIKNNYINNLKYLYKIFNNKDVKIIRESPSRELLKTFGGFMTEYNDDCEISENNTNDLYGMCYDILGSVNFKSLIFLYIIYILLSSNVFGKYILEQKNMDDDKYNIDNIILLKGLYLVLFYMFILILIKMNIL